MDQALLNQIKSGARLKRVNCNDRSAPIISSGNSTGKNSLAPKNDLINEKRMVTNKPVVQTQYNTNNNVNKFATLGRLPATPTQKSGGDNISAAPVPLHLPPINNLNLNHGGSSKSNHQYTNNNNLFNSNKKSINVSNNDQQSIPFNHYTQNSVIGNGMPPPLPERPPAVRRLLQHPNNSSVSLSSSGVPNHSNYPSAATAFADGSYQPKQTRESPFRNIIDNPIRGYEGGPGYRENTAGGACSQFNTAITPSRNLNQINRSLISQQTNNGDDNVNHYQFNRNNNNNSSNSSINAITKFQNNSFVINDDAFKQQQQNLLHSSHSTSSLSRSSSPNKIFNSVLPTTGLPSSHFQNRNFHAPPFSPPSFSTNINANNKTVHAPNNKFMSTNSYDSLNNNNNCYLKKSPSPPPPPRFVSQTNNPNPNYSADRNNKNNRSLTSLVEDRSKNYNDAFLINNTLNYMVYQQQQQHPQGGRILGDISFLNSTTNVNAEPLPPAVDRSLKRSHLKALNDFEHRFAFKDISQLPKPHQPANFTKIYPSQIVRNRQTKGRPPPPPPAPVFGY